MSTKHIKQGSKSSSIYDPTEQFGYQGYMDDDGEIRELDEEDEYYEDDRPILNMGHPGMSNSFMTRQSRSKDYLKLNPRISNISAMNKSKKSRNSRNGFKHHPVNKSLSINMNKQSFSTHNLPSHYQTYESTTPRSRITHLTNMQHNSKPYGSKTHIRKGRSSKNIQSFGSHAH